jgi:hypothetical protein
MTEVKQSREAILPIGSKATYAFGSTLDLAERSASALWEEAAMTPPKAGKRGVGSQSKGAVDSERSRRMKQISRNTSQIVRDAASMLDEEVAAGIVAAKQMQQRFQKERRIDPGDFSQALQQFQGNAHEVITLLDDQLSELQSKENTELARRFITHTHGIVDLAVELVNMGAELANQLTPTVLDRVKSRRAKRSR